MRDRLIELTKASLLRHIDKSCKLAENIADDLLAEGVIVPPCKVGDAVFEIEKNCLDCKHYTDAGYSDWCECTLDDNKLMFEVDFDEDCKYRIFKTKFQYGMIDKISKTVLLTREQAEQALAEVANGT